MDRKQIEAVRNISLIQGRFFHVWITHSMKGLRSLGPGLKTFSFSNGTLEFER